MQRGAARQRAAEAAVGRRKARVWSAGAGDAGAASEVRRVQRVRRGACGACRASRRGLEHQLVVAVNVCLLEVLAADLVVLEVLVRLRLPLLPRARRLRLLVLVGGRVAHVALGAARQHWVSV